MKTSLLEASPTSEWHEGGGTEYSLALWLSPRVFITVNGHLGFVCRVLSAEKSRFCFQDPAAKQLSKAKFFPSGALKVLKYAVIWCKCRWSRHTNVFALDCVEYDEGIASFFCSRSQHSYIPQANSYSVNVSFWVYYWNLKTFCTPLFPQRWKLPLLLSINWRICMSHWGFFPDTKWSVKATLSACSPGILWLW